MLFIFMLDLSDGISSLFWWFYCSSMLCWV